MDLAQFENYSSEINQAIKGDRAALLAKLRAGVVPTKWDLMRLADLLEKRPAHRPKKTRKLTATQRLADMDDIRNVAADRYRRIMDRLRRSGRHVGMQTAVNDHVCRKCGLLNPDQFSTWRKNRRKTVVVKSPTS